MKRPFAVVGITYLIAQTVAVLCGFAVTAALFCVTLLCAFFLFILVKERPAWLMPAIISCAICFGLNAGYTLAVVRPAEVLQGQSVYITGTVCEAPVCSYGRYYYIIRTDSVSLDSAPQSVRLRLSSASNLDTDYGDSIRTPVQFNYSDTAGSSMRHLMADGVYLTAYLPYDADPVISDGKASFYGTVIGLRDRFCRAATELLGDELGGLLVGMFTGDTSGIDNTLLGKFRDCGLSHLFAVSGLHLSMLLAVLTVLLRRIAPDYRATSLMSIPFVLFFMAFAGFSMSVRRAGIMLLLNLIAMAIKREADSLNSLGIAALIVCLLNPFAAGDAGLLMSFACTLGLIALSSPLEARLRSLFRFSPASRAAFILRPLINTLSASLISSLCVFPITVLCFGEISLIGPFANMLCIYPASAFMVLGALGTALSCIPLLGPILGFVLYVPVWLIGRLLIALCGLMSCVPGAGVSFNYPFMSLFLFMAFALLVLWFIQFGRGKGRMYSLLFCLTLIAQLLLYSAAAYNISSLTKQSITVFHTDGGIMTALVSGGQCVLVGAGGDSYCGWTASNRLAEDNINEVLAIVLPDNTERCAGNAGDFIEQYQPDTVFLSSSGSRYELIEKTCRRSGTDMYSVTNAYFSADGCGISVLTFTDVNGKLWTWAECGGLSLLVCPEGGDCMTVPDEYASSDIALVTSEDIVNVTHISPTALIISAGSTEGRHAEAVLSYRGAKNIFSTAEDGCIVVTEHGQGIRIDEQ